MCRTRRREICWPNSHRGNREMKKRWQLCLLHKISRLVRVTAKVRVVVKSDCLSIRRELLECWNGVLRCKLISADTAIPQLPTQLRICGCAFRILPISNQSRHIIQIELFSFTRVFTSVGLNRWRRSDNTALTWALGLPLPRGNSSFDFLKDISYDCFDPRGRKC